MMRGFEEDEGFWEVGLHLFMTLLPALPIGILTQYLAELANIEEHGAAAFGMVLGIYVGDAVVAGLRRRFQPEHAETGSMQPLYLILPIALPIAILFDYLLTLVGGQDVGFSAIGAMMIGMPLGHLAFHGLRDRFWRKPAGDG